MKKFISVLTALFFVLIVQAQDYEFKILASKGGNQVKVGSAWSTAKSGTQLKNGNVLKIVSGGYIGLIYKTGRTIELKTPGEYSTEALTKRIQSKASDNYASKYSKFVVSQMTDDGKSKYNYEVTGSVDRGAGDKIQLLAPEDITVLQGVPAEISWIGEASEAGYEVKILNLFNQTLYKKDAKGNHTSIDLKHANLKVGEKYIIKVIKKDDNEETKVHTISLVDQEKEKTIVEELNMIKKEVDESTALGNLIYASFFDEKDLSLYSLERFEKAMELEPEVEDFEISYKNYLASKGVFVE